MQAMTQGPRKRALLLEKTDLLVQLGRIDARAKKTVQKTVPETLIPAYSYNKRRLLNGQGEALTRPNWYSWGIGYGYDANGHLASHAYPAFLRSLRFPEAL